MDGLSDRAQRAVGVGASAVEGPVFFKEEHAACWDWCGFALAAQGDVHGISDAIEWEHWDLVAFSHAP